MLHFNLLSLYYLYCFCYCGFSFFGVYVVFLGFLGVFFFQSISFWFCIVLLVFFLSII